MKSKLPVFALAAVAMMFGTVAQADVLQRVKSSGTLRIGMRTDGKRDEIAAQAARLLPALSAAVGSGFVATVVDCASQIGSGALPQETLPSAGIAIRATGVRASGRALIALAAALRGLDKPVIGHIAEQALVLDLRCLEDDAGFVRNLAGLGLAERA